MSRMPLLVQLAVTGAFALTPAAASATVIHIASSKLANAGGGVALNLHGPVNFGTFFRDTDADLPDGTYTMVLRGGQATYGTFTLASGALAGATGALTAKGSTVDFDLDALAAVRIMGAPLAVGTGGNTTQIPEAAGTFSGTATVYLPVTANGYVLEITPRGGHGSYGAFVVTPERAVAIVASAIPNAANALGVDATSLGIIFDLKKLAAVYILGDQLTVPPSASSTVNLPEVAGTFFGKALVYLPPNRAPATLPYAVTPRGGQGVYGTFTVAPDLSVVLAPGTALRLTPAGIGFVRCALNNLHVETSAGVHVGIPEAVGFVQGSLTLLLPDGRYAFDYLDPSGGITNDSMILAGAGASSLPSHPDLARLETW